MFKLDLEKALNNNRGLNPRRRYSFNIGAPQHINHMPTTIKEEIDSNTIIVRDYNTPPIPVDRSFRQKINKGTQS